MAIPSVAEKWAGKMGTVAIGATAAEGGTRTSSITVGGATGLPFLFGETQMPYAPAVAMEILDIVPAWPDILAEYFKDVWGDPAAWAKKCVSQYGAKMICLRLQGTHPEFGDRSPDDAAATVKSVLKAISVPLIIVGSGDPNKDSEVLAKCSETAKGERCLIGNATQKAYKTLTASCLADGHNIIAESPIDINIAKQVNILISDMGLPVTRVVNDPTTGALGYGMQYAYSIMERARMAALSGDKMMSQPVIAFVGREVYRVKEAKTGDAETLEWGEAAVRVPMWEATTAISVLQAGADILVLVHPRAVAAVEAFIAKLMAS